MRLLIVAATSLEVQPIASRFSDPRPQSAHLTHFHHPRHQIDLLVTGVGMVATAAGCAKTLAESKVDVALNFGVCGSFNPELPIGSVVHVVSDCLPELGAESGDHFLTLHDLDLLDKNAAPFQDGRLVNNAPPVSRSLAGLKAAHGITVNTVHGHEPSIARVAARWAPDVESMEGAAFMYACLSAGVAFAQVRAVSNRVERRNRDSWKIVEAIAAVTGVASRIVEEL
jgi:futalosine hydrolase